MVPGFIGWYLVFATLAGSIDERIDLSSIARFLPVPCQVRANQLSRLDHVISPFMTVLGSFFNDNAHVGKGRILSIPGC